MPEKAWKRSLVGAWAVGEEDSSSKTNKSTNMEDKSEDDIKLTKKNDHHKAHLGLGTSKRRGACRLDVVLYNK
jgi:hypothetical protein